MSRIKNLFDGKGSNKILVNTNLNEAGNVVESADYAKSKIQQINRFIPNINFSTSSNFVVYGSAEKYYEDSINYIRNEYPYDGSLREKINWELSGTYLDQYLLENEYPRTNGFVNIGLNYDRGASQIGPGGADALYYNSTTREHIQTKGYSVHNKDIDTTPISDIFDDLSVYNTASNAITSLDVNGVSGSTVEFWFKKDSWSSANESYRQTVFDLWNGKTDTEYGRLRVDINFSSDKFAVEYRSGSYGISGTIANELGENLNIATGSWNHYAVSFSNSGSYAVAKLYRNGVLNDTISQSSTPSIGSVTGSMISRIGSLTSRMPNDNGELVDASTQSWGKLSGSIDEFRFWKIERTEKDIKENWFTQVNGGTNSDFALQNSSSAKYDYDTPINLGVYYKFNEGIIGSSSVNSQDSVVLDYSGKAVNGSWTGYSLGARDTRSAMVLSNAAASEFKDPILYIENQMLSSFITQKKDAAIFYDQNNNSSLYNSLPSWMALEDIDKERSPLKDLTQVLGSYFDTLHAQIESVNKIKNRVYASGTFEPVPFANRLINNLGLVNDEIFLNSSDLEYFASRNEKEEFEKKLEETKNLIYLNIYNNLINIFKSKGTEKSFRNLIRCFGIDDTLVRLNLYADESEYSLLNNARYDVVRKKYVDFFDPSRFSATVFQSASAADTDSTSFISSSDYMKFNGNTYECEAFFIPNPTPSITSSFNVEFLTSSVYGCHSVDGANQDEYLSPDAGNFQVYAIRDNLKRNEAKFMLTGTAGGFVPEITTDIFKDVYDNTKWNLSVRVYPSASFAGSVTGSDDDKNYYVRFTGYQYSLDDLVNSFDISSSIPQADAQSFLAANKRFFVGAHRTNFTGSVLEKANAQISSMRVWADSLDNETLQYHAQHALNYGTQNPRRNAYLAQSGSQLGLNITQIPQIETLLMNWDYDNVTGSDSSGEFTVNDLSSGSLSLTERYGWFGPIAKYKYPGQGFGFEASSNNVYKKKFVNTLRQQLPETVNSSDMINIVSENTNELYTTNSRPVQYYYSFEKSMYSIISDEIIKSFATIVDFNNLIGEPVNKYRQDYKKLTKLRELYFERVENDPDFERFVEYYKWIDSAIAGMLQQLTPASAEGFDGMKNMVESHILERNKHRSKLPFIKQKQISLIARAQTPVTINQSGFNTIPPNTSRYVPPILRVYSNEQAENKTLENIRSFDPENLNNYQDDIDAGILGDRDALVRVVKAMCPEKDDVKACVTALMQGIGVNDDTRIAKIVSSIISSPVYIDGGSNTTNKSKRSDFTQNTLKPGSSRKLSVPSTDITNKEYDKDFQKRVEKAKLTFKYEDSEDPFGYTSDRGDHSAPFSAYSSSANAGYITTINDSIGSLDPSVPAATSIDVTNYHDDSYGDGAIPMQGPFTNEHVGGRQARHQGLVKAPITDGDSRPEEWNFALAGGNIEITTRDLQQAKALYLRDQTAKRPVNIKNIKWNTGSATPGNYRFDYEMLQTSDRTLNNRYFVKSEGATPTNASSSYVKDVFDYELPRFDLTGTNKSIFVERFSAPGGPETAGGGLNIFSGEYSVYNTLNYRNSIVRDSLDSWATEHCGPFGVKSGSSVNELDYDTNASYFKVNRNARHTVTENDSCATKYDNWWIQHAIPQSAYQYSWITASVSKSACDTFGYVSQFYVPSGSTSVTQSGLPFVTSGSLPLGSDGAAFIDINYAAIFFADEYGGFASQYVNQVTSSENLIKPGTLFTENASIASDINAYLLNLNGPYQYPSWKQIRTGENIIFRNQKKQNILSVSPHPQKIVTLPDGRGPGNKIEYLPKRPSTFTNFVQPMVSFKSRPLETTLTEGDESFTLVSSYGVNKDYFSQPINLTKSVGEQINLTQKQSIEVYDNLTQNPETAQNIRSNIYTEVVYPRDMMTGLSGSRGRTEYAEVALTTGNGSASLSDGNNGIDRGPLLRRTFWKDSIADRNRRSLTNGVINEDSSQDESSYYPVISSTLPNSQGHFDGAATSINGWGNTPLTFIQGQYGGGFATKPQSLSASGGQYSSIDAGTANPSELVQVNYPDTGELNSANTNTIFGYVGVLTGSSIEGTFAYQTTEYPTASVYYYHKSFKDIKLLTGSLGRLRWRVSELSGKDPWYNSYEDYASDIRVMAKDYSIVPEFRISQHMDYYSDLAFKKKNDKFLTLDGARITASAFSEIESDGKRRFNSAFFNEYSNTDFQKYFGNFSENYDQSRITLKCNAVKKLLPYHGFYPAHRTLQIASLFSQSIAPHIGGLGFKDGIPTGSGNEFSGALAVQSMLQPYYAPGIMYNTIKSGIAVDFGAMTGSAFSGSADQNIGGLLLSASNYRIPFESILDPISDIGIPVSSSDGDKKVSLLYPTYHTTQFSNKKFSNPREAFVDITIEGREKVRSSATYNLYKLAVNNLFAEIPNFYLQDSKLKTIVSKRQEEVSLISGTAYYLDVVLEKDPNVVMIDDYVNKFDLARNPLGQSPFRSYNGQYFGPAVLGGDTRDMAQNLTASEIGTYLMDPLPEFGYNIWNENLSDPMYAQYTPPYFYGKSKVTLKYTADADDEKGGFSYKKLFEKSELTYANDQLQDRFSKMQKRSKFLGLVSNNGTYGQFQVDLDSTFSEYFVLSRSSGGSHWDFGATDVLSGSVTTGSFLEYKVLQSNDALMVGLSPNPLDHMTGPSNYTGLKFAIHNDGTSNVNIFESGVNVASAVTTYSADDWFRIKIDNDGNVLYQKTSQQGYMRGIIDGEERSFTPPNATAFKYGINYETFYTSTTSSDDIGAEIYPMVTIEEDTGGIAYLQTKADRYISPAEEGSMQITASINPFGIFAEKQTRFDAKGNIIEIVDDPNESRNRWVISPRMETPVLDFSSQPHEEGSGRGMWSGYGNLLTSSNGIVFGIEETYKDGFSADSGSLLQKCFDAPEIRKVGEIADQKEISEAIVAIPYSEKEISPDDSNYAETVEIMGRNFFKIEDEVFDYYYDWYMSNKGARSASPAPQPPERRSESMEKMVSLMSKYVMPPELDFLTYFKGSEKVAPFVAYIFEFNHTLDSQDLADIWQGVQPEISRTAEMSDPSIDNNVFSHPTGSREFYGKKKMPPNVRWMVFKIKKKANINYYKLTADTSDDALFSFDGSVKGFTTPYSYNWPYDFCSLVELAQVETSTEFTQEEPTTRRELTQSIVDGKPE